MVLMVMSGRIVRWSVAGAKAKLSELLDRARFEPQIIESRGRPRAVVLSVERFEELESIASQARPSAMQDFLASCEELRRRGDLELEIEPRGREPERPPPFEGP